MKREDVIKFIRNVKNPEKFLQYCERYHELDFRDIAYVVSRSVVSRDPDNINFVLAGAKNMIVTWNIAGYQRLPRQDKKRLEKDILKAYEAVEGKLKMLRGKRLESLNLNNKVLEGDIKKVFREFSSRRSIGVTGASKVLHVVNPQVFMMWDTRIRKAYHKLHESRHKIGSPECYLEFLKQSQDIIKALLTKTSEDDLWINHKAALDKNFISAFGFKESVLKMLDECNFVRFKLGIRL